MRSVSTMAVASAMLGSGLVNGFGIAKQALDKVELRDQAGTKYGTLDLFTSWQKSGYGLEANMEMTVQILIKADDFAAASNPISDHKIALILSQDDESIAGEYAAFEPVFDAEQNYFEEMTVGDTASTVDLAKTTGAGSVWFKPLTTSYRYGLTTSRATLASGTPQARYWQLDGDKCSLPSFAVEPLTLTLKRDRG